PVVENVFGVHSFAPAIQSEWGSIDDIARCCVVVAQDVLKKGDSFAVRCSRSGKHSFSSKEVEIKSGSDILAQVNGVKVNLSAPDHTVFVDVRGAHCMVYSDPQAGLLGLPVGSQGLVALEMDAKLPWEKAGFLLLKRGCRIVGVSDAAVSQKKLDWLARFNSGASIKVVSFAELPRQRNVLALASAKTDLLAPPLERGLPVLYPLQGFPIELFPSRVLE
ncbi:MAG: THUMP domain-containing protein, partial [Candidatus Diapherotrites archaeon]|nr:THUMP domain-containing protein [Candidatus Diapherotrites archaeon]